MGNTATLSNSRNDRGGVGYVYHAEIPVSEPPLCNSRYGRKPGSVRGLNPVRYVFCKDDCRLIQDFLETVKIEKIEGASSSRLGSEPCDIIFQFTNAEPDYAVTRNALVCDDQFMEDRDRANISFVNYVACTRLFQSAMDKIGQRFTIYRYNLILYDDYVIVTIHSNFEEPEKLPLWYMFSFAVPTAIWLRVYGSVRQTDVFTILERGYPSRTHAYEGSFVKEIVLFIKGEKTCEELL